MKLFQRTRLEPHQLFGLALGGPITLENQDSFTRLKLDYGRRACAASLRDGWGVHDAGELEAMLDWLLTTGHRNEWRADVACVARGEPSEQCDETEVFLAENLDRIHRYGFSGWDLCRLVNVARCGFGARFLPEDATWGWIDRAAHAAREEASNWSDYGVSYLLGYGVWSSYSAADGVQRGRLVEHLLTAANSPWLAAPWD